MMAYTFPVVEDIPTIYREGMGSCETEDWKGVIDERWILFIRISHGSW